MAFVLDASVTASWLFPDEGGVRADAAWRLISAEEAFVPVQWWFEIANVVLLGERRGRLNRDQASSLFGRLDRMTINLDELPSRASVLELARRHQLSFYDAAYLELATRRRLALATLDRALMAAARKERVTIVGDS